MNKNTWKNRSKISSLKQGSMKRGARLKTVQSPFASP